MNGVDVNLFQFDYYMTWCAFFLNEHGHVYARYGVRQPKKDQDDSLMSKAGLQAVMKSVLDTHKAQFNKKPPPTKRLLAESLTKMPKNMGSGKKCIHCHHVYQYGKNELASHFRKRNPDQPPPESIGMTLDIDLANVVKSVVPNGRAAKAGIQAGDRILTINGQSIYSAADISWLLFKLGRNPTLSVKFSRKGVKKAVKLH